MLGDAAVRGVDGLAVGGHLAEVAVAPQDVGGLGGDGCWGHCGVSVGVGGGGGVSGSQGGSDQTSVGASQGGGEDEKLK